MPRFLWKKGFIHKMFSIEPQGGPAPQQFNPGRKARRTLEY